MMDFSPTLYEEDIRNAIKALMVEFNDGYWMSKDEAHEFPSEFYRRMADGGWLGTTLPEAYGGQGMGLTEAAIVLEEVSASGGGLNAASSIHPSIFGIQPVVVHGSDEMKSAVLPGVASGEIQICFGVTEPEAGLDTTRITTFATRRGDHYQVSGRKVWISKAEQADKILLLARTTRRDEVASKTDGFSLFLTDIDLTAMDIRPIRKFGRNAVSSSEIFIDGLTIPVEDRVGEEGKGFSYLLDGLNPERILIAAEAVGLGRAALNCAAKYANERVVFDRRIGSNQGVAFPLADSLARLDGATLAMRHAAWRYDNGMPCGREANTAKYLGAEAAFEAADRAFQTHGGMGYAEEFHVARYFREARLLRIVPISQEMILNYLSTHALGLPRSY